MAVPAADAALLAAQAKAGQAGVDAYEAAKAELTDQRQQAVQSAMQEAAMRGSPADAAASQQSIATAPYDQRIASLTQGGAAYKADMSARDQRLQDYNAAVNAARSFIPEQTAQQVAPINARANFDLKAIDRTSEGKVLGIDAQRRLVEAQMAAAALAAASRGGGGGGGRGGGGGGGGKGSDKGTLSEGKLASALVAGARDKLNAATTAIKAKAQPNMKEGNKAKFIAVMKNAAGQLAANEKASNQRVNDSMAASYMQKGLAYANGRQVSAAPTRAQAVASAISKAISAGTAKPAAPAVSGFPNARVTSTGQPINTPAQLAPTVQQRSTTQPGGMFGSAVSRLLGRPAAPSAGSLPSQPHLSSAQKAATQAAIKQLESRSAAEQMKRERIDNPFVMRQQMDTADAPFRGPRGYITDADYAGLDPFSQSLIDSSPEDFLHPTDIDRIIGGAPDSLGNKSPYAAEASRQAAYLTAGDLIDQGYDIEDPDILNALGANDVYDVGDSLFDMNQRSAGQPDTDELLSAQEKAQAAEERAGKTAVSDQEDRDKAAADALDSEIKSRFRNDFQVSMPTNLGSSEEVWHVADSRAFRQAQQKLLAQLQADEWRTNIPDTMSEIGIYDVPIRQLLSEMYG